MSKTNLIHNDLCIEIYDSSINVTNTKTGENTGILYINFRDHSTITIMIEKLMNLGECKFKAQVKQLFK